MKPDSDLEDALWKIWKKLYRMEKEHTDLHIILKRIEELLEEMKE